MKPIALIVDDSLTVRMDIGEALEAAGFSTALCADLQSAREALRRERCSLVVLDVVLPDGDGLDFLKELKSGGATKALPVLLLSTEAEIASRLRGIGAGADEYLGKPYDLGQVVARARALVRASVPPGPGANRRILVIDDSPTYRNELKQALAAASYHVHEATTGEEGLSLAARVRPDAVIVDGILPGMDGRTVVRRLKSDTALRSTPCLLLTAAEEADDELRSLEAGADAYVRKSDDLAVILARLAALLRHARVSTSEAVPSLLGTKRLLAVDDSPTYLEELGDQLRQEGHDVVLARSGEEALELLAAQRFDCILLDLLMPGLSGHETCRRIKQTPEWRDIPLVMLTAKDDREAMIEGINAGADDYIAKSADFDVLKARLRAQLRRKHFEDENRRIREELVRREAEVHFRRLVRSNIIGVIFGELDGPLTDANDAFLEMLGYARAELESGALSWDVLTSPEWLSRDREATDELRKAGSVTPFEKELLRKNGSRLPIVLGLALLEGTNRTVGFVLDRTEQKLAEEKINKYTLALESANRELGLARDQAEQSSRFKSGFLANMSHELRTPLNAIIGFAELLYDGQVRPEMPEHREFLGDILTSGRHLLQLINDVLDLSKVEAGKLEFHPEPVSPAALVAEVLAILRTSASEKRIRIETHIHPDLPEIVLDPARLKQVLFNYLSNALKFTPESGQIWVRMRPEDAGAFRLEVEDTGVGISAEDVGRLFAEFEQLDAGAAKRHAGTGLGLALTKRLVEAQGGSVGVQSVLGTGSSFYAILPRATQGRRLPSPRVFVAAPDAPVVLVVEDREDEGKNQAVPVVVITGVAERGAIGGLPVHDVLKKPFDQTALLESLRRAGILPEPAGAVLVVDDDPSSSKLMAATLGQLGYRVVCVRDGAEGLSLAQNSPPSAVVLDLLMPKMDGFEFLDSFRQCRGCEQVPVIVWTSKDLSAGEYARMGPSALAVLQKGRDVGTTVVEEIRAALASATERGR